MRVVNWVLPLSALASYLVLVLILAPRLAAETGGALPFDLRALGYSAAEAQAYLEAMSPLGRSLYLGPIRLNDTVFPILFALTLCLPMRRWHWLWCLPALAYGLLDLGENWAVARMIRAETAEGVLAPGLANVASALTMAKFAAVVVALGLAAVALWRVWRGRR